MEQMLKTVLLNDILNGL